MPLSPSSSYSGEEGRETGYCKPDVEGRECVFSNGDISGYGCMRFTCEVENDDDLEVRTAEGREELTEGIELTTDNGGGCCWSAVCGGAEKAVVDGKGVGVGPDIATAGALSPFNPEPADNECLCIDGGACPSGHTPFGIVGLNPGAEMVAGGALTVPVGAEKSTTDGGIGCARSRSGG